MKLRDIENYTEITRKSIESVKCTRIITGKGSEKYNKYIQNLARRVLKESVARTDGYKHDEVGILARLDGKFTSEPIYGYWNEKLSTSVIDVSHNIEYNYILDESMNTQSCIFMHNHPNNSMPSINDIRTFISTSEMLIMAAVGNDGKVRYVLKTEDDLYYYIKLSRVIETKLSINRTNIDSIYKKLMNNPDKYHLKIGG